MAEYIEREAAIEAIMCEPPDAHYPHWYADKIKAIPAADVAPVIHATYKSNGIACLCSHCRKSIVIEQCDDDCEMNYCINCGAKMDKEDSQCDT